MSIAKAIVLTCGLAASLSAHAQTFNNVYGRQGTETANSVDATADGGYVTAGYIRDTSTTLPDILVVKYAADGSIMWVSRFGGPGSDVGFSIEQTRDGGYIVGAETDSQGPLTNLALVRLNPVGNYMWSWVYEGDSSAEEIVHANNCGVAARETPQGTFLLTGRKRLSATSQMGVLIQTTPVGAPMWNFRYGDPRVGSNTRMGFTDVRADREGTFVVSGSEYLPVAGANLANLDPILLRVGPNGVPIWARNYNASIPNAVGPEQGTGDGLDICRDGTIVFDGRSDLSNPGSPNLHAMRVDPAGNPLWYHTFLRDSSTYRTIRQDRDDRIACAGWTGPAAATEALLLVLNQPTGLPMFARRYDYLPSALGLVPSFPGFALTGPVTPPSGVGFGGVDIELISTDFAGWVGCLDAPADPHPVTPAVQPVPFQPFIQQQVGTFWQGEFRRLDLREDRLCHPCPACPADFNQDGGVDGGDVVEFFHAWQDGLPCADVNLDGGVDGDDVRSFFHDWQNGGC